MKTLPRWILVPKLVDCRLERFSAGLNLAQRSTNSQDARTAALCSLGGNTMQNRTTSKSPSSDSSKKKFPERTHDIFDQGQGRTTAPGICSSSLSSRSQFRLQTDWK